MAITQSQAIDLMADVRRLVAGGDEPGAGMRDLIQKITEMAPHALWEELAAFDFDADQERWQTRTQDQLMANPPSDDFTYFNVVIAPLSEVTDLLIGSAQDYSPFDEEDHSAYYEDWSICDEETGVEFLNRWQRAQDELYREIGEEVGWVVERACAELYTAHLGRNSDPQRFLGGRRWRHVFAGYNDTQNLVGAFTDDGWRPVREAESEEGFRREVEGS